MPTLSEVVLGERRRSIDEGVVLEAIGFNPRGWVVAMAPNGSLSEVPADLWAEYPLVEAKGG